MSIRIRTNRFRRMGRHILRAAAEDAPPRAAGNPSGPDVAGGGPVVDLALAGRLAPSRVGSKAANLARLAAAGFPVPAGFVVTQEALDVWDEASERIAAAVGALGSGPFAARSSAAAEDLGGMSYAGQYESVLDVEAGGVPAAVLQVFQSARTARVASYQSGLATQEASVAPSSRMAVLVQPMVDADAAGVAFTADPVTGDRAAVVITAVRGTGERLVGGEAVGDQWAVTGERAECRRSREHAIDAGRARVVADLARRAEEVFGQPQDVEWAFSRGRLYVLQARPMTALPDRVEWTVPGGGWWLRNFRIGELLPEPVTPLFESWLLPAIHHGVARAMSDELGLQLEPQSRVVNGWLYTNPEPHAVAASLPRAILTHPGVLLEVPGVLRLLLAPQRAGRALASRTEEWRERLLPRYRETVAAGDAAAGSARPAELVALVDGVASVAGEYLWSVWTVAGSEWKIEAALTRFGRRHLRDVGVGMAALLSGLPGTEPALPEHAVHSMDWYWPTAGELGQEPPGADVLRHHHELGERRLESVARCRRALARRPILRRRFERLLAVAERYAVIREQQTRLTTLAWPLLRRCALRLGAMLHEREILNRPEDVFFLDRDDVTAALAAGSAGPLREVVERRRAAWEGQRRLVAPLSIGTAPAIARRMMVSRADVKVPAGAISGEPASPGRARGPVRVILDPADFASFLPGEVLVARLTAPAWTPLFARAAAVVTDGGTLAAHASLVAREYGIPAVVATGDATARLHDGQVVTVDGSTGVVEV